MTIETRDTAAEVEIRSLIDSWLKAVRAKDVAAIVSHYAPEAVAFDAIGPLQFKGKEAYGKHWAACMEFCPGEMRFDLQELTITAGRDLAFAHALTHCGTVEPDGTEKTGWMRMTTGYRRIDGQWRILHEHFSAPFDMESCKAQFDLKP